GIGSRTRNICCRIVTPPMTEANVAATDGSISGATSQDAPASEPFASVIFPIVKEGEIHTNQALVISGAITPSAPASFPRPVTVFIHGTLQRAACPDNPVSFPTLTLPSTASGNIAPTFHAIGPVGDCGPPVPGSSIKLHVGDNLVFRGTADKPLGASTTYRIHWQVASCPLQGPTCRVALPKGAACRQTTDCDSDYCNPSTNTCGAPPSTCASPTTSCSGVCVNTSTDPKNCGVCGNACAANQTCSNGACARGRRAAN